MLNFTFTVTTMADVANKYPEKYRGHSTSMNNASTAISAGKRRRPVTNATTTAAIPTFTNSPSPLRKKRSAKKPWKVARLKRSAMTAHHTRASSRVAFEKWRPEKGRPRRERKARPFGIGSRQRDRGARARGRVQGTVRSFRAACGSLKFQKGSEFVV